MQREGALITEQVKNLRLDDIVLSSIDTDALLSDCVKSSGGVLTSDLILSGANMRVYSSNYFQTDKENPNVANFSGKNSFLQAEEAWSGNGSTSYGPAVTGCKGFAILASRPATGEVKLSGDLSQLEDFVGTAGWSYSFCEGCGTSCITILDIDQTEVSAGWVKVSGADSLIATASAMTEESCIWRYENDDNAVYWPKNPMVGNLIIYNFYGNHAEGGSVKAIGKYTHAEGRATTADIRYSHAEGSFTYAGGMASHAEGQGSINEPVMALGSSSHAEGYMTKAIGDNSHAGGIYANARAKNQFVWSGTGSRGYGDGDLSAKTGSFCVNPVGGLSGFYVGNKSLEQHLIDKGAATIKADMKAALSGVFAGIDDPEDVEFGKVAAALSAIWLKVKTA